MEKTNQQRNFVFLQTDPENPQYLHQLSQDISIWDSWVAFTIHSLFTDIESTSEPTEPLNRLNILQHQSTENANHLLKWTSILSWSSLQERMQLELCRYYLSSIGCKMNWIRNRKFVDQMQSSLDPREVIKSYCRKTKYHHLLHRHHLKLVNRKHSLHRKVLIQVQQEVQWKVQLEEYSIFNIQQCLLYSRYMHFSPMFLKMIIY